MPKKQKTPNNKRDTLEELLNKQHITKRELTNILASARQAQPGKPKRLSLSTKHIKYGYFSDAHIGNKAFRQDVWDLMIRHFKKEGVEFIVDAGDHLEGMSGRPGHIYELTHIGFAEQMGYAANLYNELPVDTYGIDGNHDNWFKKKFDNGVVVGEELERRVEKYHNLGSGEGTIILSPKVKIMLFHPNDGSAYAMCFDDKTEILTENGWKLFKDLEKEEAVATLNLDKDAFEWEKPTYYTKVRYDGELLHFKARSFDLMVTPTHRMLVRRYPNNILQSRVKNIKYPKKSHRRIDFNWKAIHATELRDTKRQEWQMKRTSSKWSGQDTKEIEIPYRESKNLGVKVFHFGKQKTSDVAELIAWYVTEGYIRRSRLSITQYKKVNPLKYERIVNLFRRMGIEPHQSRDRDIQIGSVELCDWLIKECGSGSKNKHLPKWLKNQSQEILSIVFNTMVDGDGWRSRKQIGYRSISKQLLHDFQEIAIKLGYAVTENKDSVSVSGEQTSPTINRKPKSVNYNGYIYSVSVPNTFIMVRRNGRAIWSGNSYKLQKLMESFSGGEKPQIIHEGHYHKSLYMFNRNIHGFESGTLAKQTEYMRLKKLAAHVGYGIVDIYLDKKGVNRLVHEFVPYYS